MKMKLFFSLFIFLMIAATSSGQEMEKDASLMVLIPAGEFMMGKDSKEGTDFSPVHKVKIDSFYMDRHQVTNAENLRFCKVTGHRLPEF